MRAGSKAANSSKSMTIMDVNPQAVVRVMEKHQVHWLIHGHTHRPAVHTDEGGERIVLGDWYGVGTVARADAGAVQLYTLDT
jgi:UDP-2,3-diacylglucosamine hydrolase